MIFGTENKERNICCSYIHERIYISDEGRTGSGNKSKEKEKEAKKNIRRQPRVDVSYVEHTHTRLRISPSEKCATQYQRGTAIDL